MLRGTKDILVRHQEVLKGLKERLQGDRRVLPTKVVRVQRVLPSKVIRDLQVMRVTKVTKVSKVEKDTKVTSVHHH